MSGSPVGLSRALAVARPPALIAHGGGNSRKGVRESFEAGADLVEADIWSYRHRLEARHERRLPPTGLLFERWYLRWTRGDHFAFPELLDEAAGRGGVLLDFKNRRAAPELVRAALDACEGPVTVCASSQFWPILRLVHEAVPEMEMFYSIDVREQLDLFLSVVGRDGLPGGVSCNHRHLDGEMVRRFHDLGLAVVAWTVDDPARARLLAEAGVDAITTNDIPALRAALR